MPGDPEFVSAREIAERAVLKVRYIYNLHALSRRKAKHEKLAPTDLPLAVAPDTDDVRRFLWRAKDIDAWLAARAGAVREREARRAQGS